MFSMIHVSFIRREKMILPRHLRQHKHDFQQLRADRQTAKSNTVRAPCTRKLPLMQYPGFKNLDRDLQQLPEASNKSMASRSPATAYGRLRIDLKRSSPSLNNAIAGYRVLKAPLTFLRFAIAHLAIKVAHLFNRTPHAPVWFRIFLRIPGAHPVVHAQHTSPFAYII